MNQKYKYLLKNTGILTISNFASKIMVFLLVPLYTSVLSTEEYGVFDLIVSTVNLLYPILTINIADGVMRFMMDKAYEKRHVAKIGVRYVTLSALIVGLLLIPCYCFQIVESVYGMELLIFLYYLSYVLNQFFIQCAKGLEKTTAMAIAGFLSTIMMLGGNILLLLVFNWGVKGFFLANVLAQAVPALYLFFQMKFVSLLKGNQFDSGLHKEMLKYCMPLIFSTVGWWINSASDRYVVAFMCGVGASGILSVSYKIPAIINTVFGMFGQAWQISAIKEYGEKDSKKFYADSFVFINLMMCVCCSGLILLSKPLARILYAKDFYVAWQYAPFLLVSSVFNTSSGLIGPMLSASKDSKAMAKSAIYGAVVNVILNFGLIYFIGVQGASISTAVAAFVIYYIRKKAIGDVLQVEKYYKVLVMWLLLCIQALLQIYTKLCYVEIAILFAMFMLNGGILKKFIKTILRILQRKNG